MKTVYEPYPCPIGYVDIDPLNPEKQYGNCIKILPPMPFYMAQEECCIDGGHLARIEDKDDNQLIAELAPYNETAYVHELIWIGYTDTDREGYFVDFDQQYPKYQKWGTNLFGNPLPDNGIRNNTGQHCVAINYRFEGLWDDHWCADR